MIFSDASVRIHFAGLVLARKSVTFILDG